MINDPIFNSDRQYIQKILTESDSSKEMVIKSALSRPIFCRDKNNVYQIVGVNASYVNGNYVEIFVAVDVTTTIPKFDGRAVKSFYFSVDSLQNVQEISETDAKSGYQRPEWRRLQKYIEKEKKNIIQGTDYDVTPSSIGGIHSRTN